MPGHKMKKGKMGKMNFIEGLSVSAARFTNRVASNSGGMTSDIARRTAGMKKKRR